MPYIESSNYRGPKVLFNGHMQTVIPAGLRRVKGYPSLNRERINTWDNDFLDLDWARASNSKLVIISHGLEGNSTRPYMLGMIKAFCGSEYDILAWNYRGCSGEMNRAPRLYHSGATDDLSFVISHAINKGYKDILLVGFSLGGNLTLKYLGEETTECHPEVKGGVVFSVPLDLHACSVQINRKENYIYSARFTRSLKRKVLDKSAQYPELLDASKLPQMKTVYDYDEHYTAPFHGFENAIDYYTKCSSKFFLPGIKVPTLVVNAANDPFLAGDCFNPRLFEDLDQVYFELPQDGGHCGFASYKDGGMFWSEKRALAFAQEIF
ncbi:MAG: alpha/beta fold hydrolase [Bacteroidota bacterium]